MGLVRQMTRHWGPITRVEATHGEVVVLAKGLRRGLLVGLSIGRLFV